MTHLNYLLARQKQDELVDRAERARLTRGARAASRSGTRVPSADTGPDADVAIVLRIAGPGDSRALTDLAGLDSASVLRAPVLIAETDGMIRAALSLSDGAMIANPFYRTASARQLLRERAAQLSATSAQANSTAVSLFRMRFAGRRP